MKHEISGRKLNIFSWEFPDKIESEALNQAMGVSSLPWAFHHVALMADVHAGKGCTVGSVIATKDAITPAFVGVDIGCGMGAIKTSLKAKDLPENLEKLFNRLKSKIPTGFNSHEDPVSFESGAYKFLGGTEFTKKFKKLFNRFNTLHDHAQESIGRALRQIGTLGGGNHFIEVCLDTEQNVWLMLHSGSRNIGNLLATIHIGKAKKLAHNQDLPDPDMAAFLSGTPEMDAYVNDLTWAQEYAFLNREAMFLLFKEVLKREFKQIKFEDPILCHHNYVSYEKHFNQDVYVTRKGAISANAGELGIIPGSMGTRSFIVEGLGNPDSFHSASHGAGRVMSRSKAKKAFTIEDLKTQTKGVLCDLDPAVIDEIPGAYKPIEQVMENQKDLVRVVAELKQILCIKGT